MQVIYHKHFKKQYGKLPEKFQEKFDQCLIMFVKNPFNTELNNHALHGKYTGRRSIDITGDLRAIYEVDGDSINFSLIGTHHDLYGK